MTSETRPRILLVDDDSAVLRALGMLFEEDYDTLAAYDGESALKLMEDTSDIAVAVLDITMSGMSGIELAGVIRKKHPHTHIIFHTAYAGEYDEAEIEQEHHPFDYVEKGRSSTRLMRSVRHAVEAAVTADDGDLVTEAERRYGLVGASEPMLELYRTIRKVASTDSKVMILGETGTGKEVVARAIHLNSPRRKAKFGIVNCNHKTTELVEAELFGYKKGAFTGAVTDRRGLFAAANGGTVFLDEIGDLSGTTQIALLRVLDRGEFRQMGPGGDEETTDVRVVCATHRNLEQLVKDGSFREDLYYRLRAVKIILPPLSERKEDIPLLVDRFSLRHTIERGVAFSAFAPEAVAAMVEFDWPGNVRELKHAVETLIDTTDSGLITAGDVRAFFAQIGGPSGESTGSLSARLMETERTLIIGALVECDYNITAAAMLLEVERATLSKKMKRHGIDVSLLKQKN